MILFKKNVGKHILKDINNEDRYEMIQNCEKFYYEDSSDTSIKYCIDDCRNNPDNNDKYFIQNIQKCDSCSGKYYDPTNNRCIDTCLSLTNLKYSNPIDTSITQNPPQECLESCDHDYYFEEFTDSNDNKHYICKGTCDTNSGKKIDVKTNQCLSSCSSYQYEIDNSYCYPKCDIDNGYKYINTDNYDCLLSCPTGLKNLEPITTTDGKEMFLCKSNCQEDTQYKFRLGDKCLTVCPRQFNFIGNNNICKQSCDDEIRLKRYFPYSTGNDGNDYIIYKCVYKCDGTQNALDPTKTYEYYTETNPYECLEECPDDHSYYLESKEKECIAKCPIDLPYFYKQESGITVTPPYKCVDTACSSADYFLDGECKTKNDCKSSNKKYIDLNNICLPKCRDTEIKMKNFDANGDFDGTYTCLKQCTLTNYTYFANIEDEKECVKDCPIDKPFIGKDNICKTSCSEEDGLNYYEVKTISFTNPDDTTSSYKIYQCISGCNSNHKYKLSNNGIQCYSECPENYPYLSYGELNENICYDNCLNSPINTFSLTTEDNSGNIIRKCLSACENPKIYFGDNKVCVDNCDVFSDTIIVDPSQNNKCVKKCDINSTYKYQLNNKCATKCDPVSLTNPTEPADSSKINIRYSKGDYLCKPRCLSPENIVKNNEECVDTCDGFLNVLGSSSNGEFECLISCPATAPNYYSLDKKCISSCHTGDKIVDDTGMCINRCEELKDKTYYYYADNAGIEYCKLQCPEDKPYINDNNECVDQCPNDKKYFVMTSTHSGDNNIILKKCLNDCPSTYPYYRKITDNNGKEAYPCEGNCYTYIVPNDDEAIIGQECINDCPIMEGSIYKFKLISAEGTIKKCYTECPTGFRYHFDTTQTGQNDNNCYKECPESSPFHIKGQLICKNKNELNGGYILYEEKEWTNSITKCPSKYKYLSKIIKDTEANSIYICSNECISEFGAYLTP